MIIKGTQTIVDAGQIVLVNFFKSILQYLIVIQQVFYKHHPKA